MLILFIADIFLIIIFLLLIYKPVDVKVIFIVKFFLEITLILL